MLWQGKFFELGLLMFSRVPFLWAVALLVQFSACAQSVVSVHAGVIHFFEGSIFVDGQQLEPKFGKFYDLKQGSELRTDEGRAEVLLTPGVLLRLDEYSSIRMLSNRLTDAQVEFIGGSAALDSVNAAPDPPVTISYGGYTVHFRKRGHYSLNSVPAELRVEFGQAEVTFDGRSVALIAPDTLPFTPGLRARSATENTDDGFDRWAKERSESISADSASAAASDDMSSALDNPQSGSYDVSAYPYFPASLSPGSAASTPWVPLSPYSLFSVPMVGYGYIPLYRRWQTLPGYRPLSPIRTGPFVPAPLHPPSPVTPVPPFRPIAPKTIPHSGVHAIGHR